jgi:type I restriction enzyme S subunit
MENNLPKGWLVKSVNDVALKVQYGYTGKVIEKGSHYYLRITDIQNGKVNWDTVPYCEINKKDVSNYELNNGDILFARTGGTVGKSFLFKENEKSIFASYLIRVVPNLEKAIAEYLYLFFQSPLYWAQVRNAEMGAAQPNVNGSKLGKINLPLPPLPEQQCIVSKLDSLFERIDKSIALVQENIKLAENLMASVLDEVFGVIEKSLFKPIFDINSANNVTISPKEGTTYNYIALENIESNTGRLIDFNSSKGETIKSSKVKFEKGAVLYGKLRPYLNKVWVATFDGICTTEILPFNPNEKILNSNFLSYYLRSPKFVDFVNSNTSGARMPRATTSFFKTKAKVPIPNLEIQEKIVKKLDLAFDKHQTLIQELQIQLSNFNALKSSLLDSAFKGEL